jgi:hypothetical protein
MGVNHPNLLCLKDTFDEADGVYLVLELAPEGELFNLIVSRQKFSEEETRHIFVQLFEGLKYLVSSLFIGSQSTLPFNHPFCRWEANPRWKRRLGLISNTA